LAVSVRHSTIDCMVQRSGDGVAHPLQIERDWTQASLKKDAVALDKILGDDWVGMDFEGKQFYESASIIRPQVRRERASND